MASTTLTKSDLPLMKGDVYRRTHRSTVVGILGDRAPQVASRGSRFYNVDRWTLRAFVGFMCEWAHNHPGCVPTSTEVEAWTHAANLAHTRSREIVIANTPDQLSTRTAMALVGGGMHEAWHTKYSCTRPLKLNEMVKLVIPRWAVVPDWSKFYQMLQEWNNIVEDIRIERLGVKEFPGSRTKMHDLQDFILQQEDQGLANLKAHGAPTGRGALSIVTAVFRDVGLGYNTTIQREAMAKYRKEDSSAVNFVLAGPLSDILHETILLKEEDDIACVRIAMDVIATLYASSSANDPANDPNNPSNQPGAAHKEKCPKCKAPGNKLVVRPAAAYAASQGTSGKGILTCSVCGYQEEVDLQKGQKGQKGQKADPNAPKFEGFDPPKKSDDKDDKDGSDKDGSDKAKPNKAKSNKADSSDESSADDDAGESDAGESDAGESDAGESDAGGKGGKDEDDGEDADDTLSSDSSDSSDDSDSDGSDSDDSDDSPSSSDSADGESESGNGGGAGGHCEQKQQIDGNNWSALADAALAQAEIKSGLLDNNSALEQGVNEAQAKEDEADGMDGGEEKWNPYDPSLDQMLVVGASRSGADKDRSNADALYDSVKSEASFLRARLRQIIQAMEMVSTVHGLPKGRRLSSRFLVESKAALMGKAQPKRAYMQQDEKLDVSMAAAVILDQSGSMSCRLHDATRIMMAITEPLDALGCAVQVSGFRDGEGSRWGGEEGDNYHRYTGIIHDIFKTFSEPFRSVKYRFSNTRATGGTPMADGIQFGLDSLNLRNEGHRVMFVITDGEPNSNHYSIIKRQLRLAKDAGIHIIGVGLGVEAAFVKTLFPDNVWTREVSEMPKALVDKLNELIDLRASKRGCRLRNAG